MKHSSGKLLITSTVSVTIEAFLLPFARHYRELGWTVHALASGASQSAACRETFDAVWETAWSRTPLDLSGNLEGAKYVRELVNTHRYDLVHVHTPVASFMTRAALRKDRVKVVYTAHGFHFFKGGSAHKNLIFSGLEKVAGRWTDALVVMNREDEDAAKRYRIVDDERLFYMPGIGIDLEKYCASAVSDEEVAKLREELGITPEQFVFLKVAEMIPRKRHEDALRAFATVGDKAVLLLAGEGRLWSDLERLAAELGIADRVRFLGQRPDVPALMELANVVVLVSGQEGLPRCIMEAMAMGKPVVGTNVRGARDLLASGGGMVAPVGDVPAIAYAMKKLIDKPDIGVAMGEKGFAAVRQYDLQNVIKLHDELYEKVLSN